MTVMPELERALVDAAQRRYGRAGVARWLHGISRPVRMAVPALVVAGLLAGAVLLVRGLGGEGDEERAVPVAPTPGSNHRQALESKFEVFRRARKPQDALPYGREQRRRVERAGGRRGWPRFELQRSRLVARLGETRAFLVPGTAADGSVSLCSFTFSTDGRGGGGGCGPLLRINERRPTLSWGPPRRGRPGTLLGVFPNGVKEVRITLRDGTIVRRPVRDNAVFVSLPSALTSMAWTGSTGSRYVRSFADSDPNEQPAARGCPALESLPPDATRRAAEAALAARTRLYPGTSAAEVTTVRRLRAGDREPTVEMTCGQQTADRTLVVELELQLPPGSQNSRSQGTLLVGQSKGRMIAWQQLR